MHKIWLILLLCLSCLDTKAQAPEATWQEAWQETMNTEDYEELQAEDVYEQLGQLARHPIELNTATRDELECLPFLSAQQVMDLLAYRDRHGAFRSMNELRMVGSLDYRQLRLLPFFARCGEERSEESRLPTLGDIVQNGRHELMGSARLPFYERKGDDNGYLGYRYRHWLRYEYESKDHARLGFTGAQDAGEPFFGQYNRWGYDVYNYYLQLSHLGPLETAVAGMFKLSSGMGLVLNNSFAPGKQAMLQNLGRPTHMLRPHTSRSVASHFQGLGATVRLSKALRLTAFASYRSIDATLNDDGSARTIVTNGYHRTLTEMRKKNNTRRTDFGGSLGWRHEGLHAEVTAVHTQFDRELSPGQSALYRRYMPSGRRFTNASISYGYMSHRLALSGETAIDQDGHMATINAMSYQPGDGLSLIALHRFYSYRYTAIHAHAFGEGSQVQNEQGGYLGGSWRMARRLSLSAYVDYATFPWARYRVSQPSSAKDLLVEVDYQLHRHWRLHGRYRLHGKEQDDSLSSGLRKVAEHRARLALHYDNSQSPWSLRTQFDVMRRKAYEAEDGMMTSLRLGWKHKWVALSALAAWFDTDSYASRLYVYEQQLAHEYAIPTYYGRGVRLSLLTRADVSRHLRLSFRLGHTQYKDRPTIGSGLQQVNRSSLTDLDLQIRWKF